MLRGVYPKKNCEELELACRRHAKKFEHGRIIVPLNCTQGIKFVLLKNIYPCKMPEGIVIRFRNFVWAPMTLLGRQFSKVVIGFQNFG